MNELILLEDLGMLYRKETSKLKRRFGLYKCYCRNEFTASFSDVKNGNTKSCGCLHKKTMREMKTTHGLIEHRLYRIYKTMIQRCNNKNNKSYEYYGGSGIIICDEWLNDFLLFYNWSLQNGYEDNLSIDRINNKGNYEPSNCRWATFETQKRNTRKIRITNTSGYRGVYLRKETKKYYSMIGVNKKHIYLGVFTDIIEAAKAYDNYVINNNLEHTRNFI